VIYYQFRADRARRTLCGIDEQAAKAAKAVAGLAPVKRNRFIALDGATKSVNRELEAREQRGAGGQGQRAVLGLPGHASPCGPRVLRKPTRIARTRVKAAATTSTTPSEMCCRSSPKRVDPQRRATALGHPENAQQLARRMTGPQSSKPRSLAEQHKTNTTVPVRVH
jgi:hypothetical protein